LRIIQPQQHKLHYYTFFDEPELYYSLIYEWLKQSNKYGNEIVEDKKGRKHNQIKQPIFIGDDSFNFRCKYGMTYRKEGDDYKRNFEYEVKLRSRDNMKSFYISFKPEISKFYHGKNEEYGDYNQYKPKKNKEGVEVQLISVNLSFEEGQELLKKIMGNLGVGKYWENQRFDIGILRQCEFYIRYHSKYERKIGMIIDDMNKVIGLCGNDYTKVTRDQENYKYTLYSLRSNRFNDLGFNTNNGKWRFAVKTYRALEHQKFKENEPLSHPKLEIYLDEEKKKGYPDLKDFFEIRNTIYQIVANIIKWAKIEDDGYIIDAYFDNEKFTEIEFIEAKEMYEKLKEFYDSLMPQVKGLCYSNLTFIHYLRELSINGQLDYESLSNNLGFGTDWIRKLTYKMESMKIITRIRSTNTIVQFHSYKVMEIVKSIIKMIDFEKELSEEYYEEIKEERIERRKQRKKHIFNTFEVPRERVNILLENKFIPYINGGLYEIRNYEIIEPPPPFDLDILGGDK